MYLFILILSIIQTFTKKFIPFLPIIIMCTMIAGFRNEVGKDYISYKNIFEHIQSLQDYPLIEPGFKYLVLALKSFNLNYLWIFFIIGAISLFFYYRGIVQQTKYTYFAFFIFFNTYIVTAIYSGLRQGLVMGIFLFMLTSLYERKFLHVLISTVIAFSIHITGILILISYLVPKKIVIPKKYIIIALLVSFLFLFIDVSKYLFDYFPLYLQMKFVDYSEAFDEKINLIRVLQRVFLIIPFVYYYDLIVKKSDRLKYFFYIYLIGYFVYIVFSFNLAFATKINQFFRVLEIIMFPMLLELIKSKFNKSFLFILVVVWSTSILFLFITIPENYPYKIWNIF
jgi:hypothetical protein